MDRTSKCIDQIERSTTRNEKGGKGRLESVLASIALLRVRARTHARTHMPHLTNVDACIYVVYRYRYREWRGGAEK